MSRRNLLSAGALLAAAFLTIGYYVNAADEKNPRHHHKHGPFADCARACDDCARSCDSCATHCAKLLAKGEKEHLKTLQTCQDCATHCTAASSITAREGPFSDLICTACADACRRCGEVCEKFRDDEMMRDCAQECRRCEKACREMLKHVARYGR